jgi:arylsulfatase A-like enzyme
MIMGAGPEPHGVTTNDWEPNKFEKEKKPDFTFIHLNHVDSAGHDHGHGTPKYYQAVADADRLIGLILQALKDAGMAKNTIVLITADHGGKGKGHGGATMGEIEIPWILAGPGVVAGKELTTHVNTYDTAATIAYIFGLKTPSCWIARPVMEAFTINATGR